MMQHAHISDVMFTNEFLQDWDDAPPRIQRRANRLLEMIGISHKFPTSMRVRQAFKNDLWMGNVTQNNQAWRILFWVEDEGIMMVHRLLTHDKRDEYLRI